eukprot:scaffold912_cov119-Cylindrotheca_fusiformis.AAC.2
MLCFALETIPRNVIAFLNSVLDLVSFINNLPSDLASGSILMLASFLMISSNLNRDLWPGMPRMCCIGTSVSLCYDTSSICKLQKSLKTGQGVKLRSSDLVVQAEVDRVNATSVHHQTARYPASGLPSGCWLGHLAVARPSGSGSAIWLSKPTLTGQELLGKYEGFGMKGRAVSAWDKMLYNPKLTTVAPYRMVFPRQSKNLALLKIQESPDRRS